MITRIIVFLLYFFYAGISVAQHSMNMKGNVKEKKVAVLIYNHVVPLDYVPSMEIFRAAGHDSEYSVFTVGEKRDSVFTIFGDYVNTRVSFDKCPSIDVLIIPGGDWIHIMEHKEVVDFIKEQYAKGTILYSVCTGAYVLAKMGLLDNIKSTSIHAQLNILKELAPKTIIMSDQSYVDSGQIITAAGAGTAIDASLHLLERLSGKEKAGWVASTILDYPYWKK